MEIVFAIFAIGLAVTLVVAKGILQANDFAKEKLEEMERSIREDNSVP